MSDGILALLAIRLGSMTISLSLPHAANGRFKAMISCDPVPGFGRYGLLSSDFSVVLGSVTKAVIGGITARRTSCEIEIFESFPSNSAR